jgi:hypothetical protein
VAAVVVVVDLSVVVVEAVVLYMFQIIQLHPEPQLLLQ